MNDAKDFIELASDLFIWPSFLGYTSYLGYIPNLENQFRRSFNLRLRFRSNCSISKQMFQNFVCYKQMQKSRNLTLFM